MAQFDVYKFDLEGFFSSKRWCTSFYYVQNEADSGGDAEAIATALGVQGKLVMWTGGLINVTSPQITQDRYKCQRYGPTKATPDFTSYTPEAGTDIGDAMANSSSVVVTKYPFFWDRDFIGRNYLPPPIDTDEDYNKLTVAGVASYDINVGSAIMATLSIVTPEALTFDQVILSQKRFKAFMDPLLPPTPWTGVFSKVKSTVVQPVLGTQRRRRPPRDSAPAA